MKSHLRYAANEIVIVFSDDAEIDNFVEVFVFDVLEPKVWSALKRKLLHV